MGSQRIVPVQLGTTALAVVPGPGDKPHLSIVPATGKPKLVPLRGPGGIAHLPVIPGKDAALVIVGDLLDVELVDATGTIKPLAPFYGQNAYRRAATVPLAPGKHTLRFGEYETDVDARRGDLLCIVHDYKTHVAVLRNGRPVTTGAFRNVPERPEVAVDGTVVASFGDTEDVIGGKKYARLKRTPSKKLLGELAYQGESLSIARTKGFEYHAARVPLGDGEVPHTLAIAVARVP